MDASPVWFGVSIVSPGLKHAADSQREKILSKVSWYSTWICNGLLLKDTQKSFFFSVNIVLVLHYPISPTRTGYSNITESNKYFLNKARKGWEMVPSVDRGLLALELEPQSSHF